MTEKSEFDFGGIHIKTVHICPENFDNGKALEV